MKAFIRKSEIQKVIKRLDLADDRIRDQIGDALGYAGMNVESNAKVNAPVNLNRLRSSIQHDLDRRNLAVSIKAGGTSPRGDLFYAPFVEFGTKSKVRVPAGYSQFAAQYKGSRTGTFQQLLKAITQWVKDKRIDEDAAFPIALSIAKKGIRAQPYLVPAFERERQPLIQRLKKIKP